MRRTLPQDIRALLPVEQLITANERRAQRAARERVLVAVALAGWILFFTTLALVAAR